MTRHRKRAAVRAEKSMLNGPVAKADRRDPMWQRLRGALCEHHGLLESLDEYADRLWFVIRNAKGRAGSTLDGLSADAAEEVQV